MRRHQLCVLLIVGVPLHGLSAAHAASYTFTTIDDDPGAQQTIPYGVNNLGQIVGTWIDTVRGHGFLLDHGTFTTIDLPDSSTINVFGINNSGEIVGLAAGPTGQQGFVFFHETFTTIHVPGSRDTGATGINDQDEIVGVYGDASGAFDFLLAQSRYTPIVVPGPVETFARINNRGQILGCCFPSEQSFLLEDGVFTPLDVPLPGLALGLNDTGYIVGFYQDASGDHGFLLSDGTVTPIDVPGTNRTYAYGINDRGDIVGAYIVNGLYHGFLATPTKK